MIILRIKTLCRLLAALSLASCSTTKYLPQGERLYTGIRQIDIADAREDEAAFSAAVEEVEAALAYPPNNALFGSSSTRTPLPVGLWIYNALVNRKGKAWKWMFDKFAARPVLLTTVNPDVRVAIARNVLRENGYFNAETSYEIIPNAKDSRKAGISYHVVMNGLYVYDSIRYLPTRSQADSLISAQAAASLLRPGAPFNVARLEAERQRMSSLLRRHGFYYHRPEYTVYLADTLLSPGRVQLRVGRKPGLPPSALMPYRTGRRSVWLYGYNNEPPSDSVVYKDLTVHYEGRLRVRPGVIYERIMLREGDIYSEDRQQNTQTALSNLDVFRYTEALFTPRDTSRGNDILDMRLNTVYDLPLDGELELNVTDKTNNLRGPGAIFSLTRRNLFGGGEVFRAQVKGSYEWQTGRDRAGLNSYEAGASATLTLPFASLPGFSHRGLLYPTHTAFSLYTSLLNRARFFRMISMGASVAYEFQPSAFHHHSFTPLKLTYNRLQSTTAEFDEIASLNPVLFMSLADQFIPAFGYAYTFDDSSVARQRHHIWWEVSLTEAGNFLSAFYALAGQGWNRQGKKLFDNPFAQFLKVTAEVRYNYRLDRNNRIVGRLMAGGIFSYGNALYAPFSEQFYLGGASSLRAFSIRSIGPGRFRPQDPEENKYAYIDQTGDLKLEANLEYRFRILGDLYGAVFADWGGLWLVREDASRPGGSFSPRRFFLDMALDAGAGLRYDLDFLVVRFDVGVGLHLPYDTGRSGYYNIPRFSDALGFHLAIGYPF
ncbi:MAG: BamA/TamA family outer membrane protein [Tannerellaceae bacterium]|jgi:outer membrane protein assembly factor BamA|nr:BamA/TamA family outer membrane protein [Tannerellaceae bacterium]